MLTVHSIPFHTTEPPSVQPFSATNADQNYQPHQDTNAHVRDDRSYVCVCVVCCVALPYRCVLVGFPCVLTVHSAQSQCMQCSAVPHTERRKKERKKEKGRTKENAYERTHREERYDMLQNSTPPITESGAIATSNTGSVSVGDAAAIAQLTQAIQQLHLQFGSIAASLTRVVQQLETITTATTTTQTRGDNNHTPTPKQTTQQIAQSLTPPIPAHAVDQPSNPPQDDDANNSTSTIDEPKVHDELDDIVYDDVSDSPDVVLSSCDDEEDESHMNRHRKAADDELENEESETTRPGEGENSMSSHVRITNRIRPKKATSQQISKQQTQHQQQQQQQQQQQPIDPSSILLQQSPNHHRSTQSMPPSSTLHSSSSLSSLSPGSPRTHLTSTVLNSNSSTLAPFFRRGTSNSLPQHHTTTSTTPAATIAIQSSPTALPLDAPDAVSSPVRPIIGGGGAISPTNLRMARPNTSTAAASSCSPLYRSLNGHGSSQSLSLEAMTDLHAQHIFLTSDNKIKLNVGGQLFCTTLTTLLREPTSMFSGMFSGHFQLGLDGGGAMRDSVFIDRDPTMFRHVLNYLRDGSICLDGMTSVQKKALIKEARYFGLQGLLGLLQLDSRATKNAQRRELSSEKEYRLVEDVPQKEIANVIRNYTMMEGYEFENWLNSSTVTTKSSSKSSVADVGCVHLLFSKKLSRGELMLLDRLENHM